LEFGEVVIVEGENQRKTLRARQQPTKHSTHIWYQASTKPRLHWWKASTLTTVPSLLPRENKNWFEKSGSLGN